MKLVALIMISGAMLALAGCGDDESSAGAGGQQPTDGGSQALGAKPEIEPPSGPQPKEVVVEDLEEGTGPPARLGDKVKVRFVGVNQDGDQIYNNWIESEPPLRFELGEAPYGSAWDKGLIGMKVGGRREVHIPAGMAYQEPGPLYYVVELVGLEPASSEDGAGRDGGASPGR